VAKLLGIKPAQVKINMLYAGGSFGRRANPDSDYVLEAVSIAKAIGGGAPVKLVWTREDDMHAGYYRPMYFHRMQAGLDDKGMPIAWQHRIVGQSILTGTAFESAMVKDGVDQTSVEGAANVPYAVSNIRVDLHSPKLPVPVQWWRSVGSSHTAFAVETFVDELAARAGTDPVAYRQALLADHPRDRQVLALAAHKAGWGSPLGEHRGRGVAVHKSFNTYVAQVAEVTLNDDNTFSVDRVVIAVDCGVAVNPDNIRAQMEGGMGFGLAAALSSEITFQDGRVQQSNFDGYTVLRMDQMPQVEVHIVQSDESPTGVGEPATPVIAPAVANALASITGKRYYQLPLRLNA
jgi:isoquinoline 1-oxidoreductase beta subunit